MNKEETTMPAAEWLNKYESMKEKLACKTDLDAHFTEKVIGSMAVDVLDIGSVHFPTGTVSYTHLVIGVEFATIFQALCSKVTIVERGPHLLSPMDGEVAAALKQQLTEKGITIYCNSVVEEITEEEGLNCHIRNLETEEVHTTKATQVVSAIGRVPYIDCLLYTSRCV